MFTTFFYELRKAQVPVSLKEYLALMEAMRQGIADYSVEDFYYLSRTCLVKDERNIDRFDQVFSPVFKGLEGVADGTDPVRALTDAVHCRELGGAADPAAVLDWRLEPATGRPTQPGPLPWLPGLPTSLAHHHDWGDYLQRRHQLVVDLDDTAFELPPDTLTGPTRAMIVGSYKTEDRLLLVLDVDECVNTASAPANRSAP